MRLFVPCIRRRMTAVVKSGCGPEPCHASGLLPTADATATRANDGFGPNTDCLSANGYGRAPQHLCLVGRRPRCAASTSKSGP